MTDENEAFYNKIVYPELEAFSKSWKVTIAFHFWEQRESLDRMHENWLALEGFVSFFNTEPHWDVLDRTYYKWKINSNSSGYEIYKQISLEDALRVGRNPIARFLVDPISWLLVASLGAGIGASISETHRTLGQYLMYGPVAFFVVLGSWEYISLGFIKRRKRDKLLPLINDARFLRKAISVLDEKRQASRSSLEPMRNLLLADEKENLQKLANLALREEKNIQERERLHQKRLQTSKKELTDDEIFVAITPDAYPTLATYSQEMIVPAVKSLMLSEQASLDTVLMNLEMDLAEREQMS